MVDENGFLQDDDAVSRYSEDDQADVEVHDQIAMVLNILLVIIRITTDSVVILQETVLINHGESEMRNH